jgi:hypothetical protein
LADEVKNLLLQVDASVELMRRNLAQGIGSLNQFEREATRTSDQASAAFARIDKAAALARTSIVAFVGGIGIGGIAQISRAVLQLGDDLSTAADQANVSVERYQTLREGFRALELSTEQTDQVLKRLSETLGAVQGGTAAAGVVEALDRMGVTSRILNGEIDTTDELLDAIAASAGSFATEAEFTASVVDILGRKVGIDLAAALRDGGANLKKLEDDFRSAGNVIDRDMIQRLADANETIDRFTSTLQARTAITVANILRDIGAVGRALSNIGNEGLLTALGRENSRIKSRDLETLTNASLAATGANSLSAFGRLSPSRPAPARIVTPPRTSGAGIRTSAPPRSARPGASAEDRLADARAGSFQGVAARLTAEAGQPLSAIGTELDQIQRAAQRAGEQLATGFQLGEELSRNISRNLAQGVVFGNNIGDALVNSFKAAAAEALTNGLFDLLTGGRGGGIIGTLANTLGAFLGGAFANGGRPPVGRISLVGERGPELFVPDAAGVIIPNNRMGGGGTVINVDARGATDPAAMERAAFTAFLAARQYTDQSFDQRSRVRLARGAGAA